MHASKAMQGLVEAVNAETCRDFVASLGRKQNLGAWTALVVGITSPVASSLCEGLCRQVNSALELVERLESDNHGQTSSDSPATIPAAPAKIAVLDIANQTIQHAAHIATALLLETLDNIPGCLLELAVLLHDRCILDLGDKIMDAAQTAVVGLCCTWWQQNSLGKEQLVAQTLPFIMVKALQSKKAIDVKLCFTMREVLTLLDFEDESIADTKRLLLRAVFLHAFLENTHGRRFLAYLLTLDAQLVREICAIMRNQIPVGKMWMLEAFGEIIFKGWRDADGAVKIEVENTCIQGLARAAISASTPNLSAALRSVLNGIHAHKRAAGVDAMLVRLYEPIIFRALSAANSIVRLNALLLLLDVFPLLDAESSTLEDMNRLLVEQFTAVSDALADPVVPVRCVAIRGVCHLVNLYWEIIPEATASAYLCRLIGELAFDNSTSSVRQAVLNGLVLLLDNQLARPVLKTLLPRLGSLIADKNAKVRQALAELLLAASRCKDLAVHEAVPLEVMVEVLGRDEPSVVSIVQQLLLPCYFPTPEEGVAHVPVLLKHNPEAGAAFCRWLAAGPSDKSAGLPQVRIALEHITELASKLMQHLLKAGQLLQGLDDDTTGRPNKRAATSKKRRAAPKKTAAGKRKRKGGSKADAENVDEEDTVQPNQVTPLEWESMLLGLLELCLGLQSRLQQAEEEDTEGVAAATMEAIIPHTGLVQLLTMCPSQKARSYVWRLAAAFPTHPASTELRSSCLEIIETEDGLHTLLGNVGDTGAGREEVEAMLLCLLNDNGLAALVILALRNSFNNSKPEVSVCPKVVCSNNEACSVCGQTEPAETMLLCDGCDSGWHLECLQPALDAVPEETWFCPCCDRHIARLHMPRDAAISCLDTMLEMPSVRQRLLDIQAIQELLQSMAIATDKLLQTLVNQLTGPSTQHDHPEPSSPSGLVQAATPKARKRRRRHGANKQAESGDTPSTSGRHDSVRDEGDNGEVSQAAVSILLRSTLHLVLDAVARPTRYQGQEGGHEGVCIPLPRLLDVVKQAVIQCTELAYELHQAIERIPNDDPESPIEFPAGVQEAVVLLVEVLMICSDSMQLGIVFSGATDKDDDLLDTFNNFATRCLLVLAAALERKHAWNQDCMLVHVKASYLVLKCLITKARLQGEHPSRQGAAMQLEPLLDGEKTTESYCEVACDTAKHMMRALTGTGGEALEDALSLFIRPLLTCLFKQGVKVPPSWLDPVAEFTSWTISKSWQESNELGTGGVENDQHQTLSGCVAMLLDGAISLKVSDVMEEQLISVAEASLQRKEWHAVLGVVGMINHMHHGGANQALANKDASFRRVKDLVANISQTLQSTEHDIAQELLKPLESLLVAWL